MSKYKKKTNLIFYFTIHIFQNKKQDMHTNSKIVLIFKTIFSLTRPWSFIWYQFSFTKKGISHLEDQVLKARIPGTFDNRCYLKCNPKLNTPPNCTENLCVNVILVELTGADCVYTVYIYHYAINYLCTCVSNTFFILMPCCF